MQIITKKGTIHSLESRDLIVPASEREYNCAEDIVSFIPVVLINNLIYKMDYMNPLHQFAFVGFSKTSGSTTQPVTVDDNMVILAGWGLTPGQTYMVGAGGALITTNDTPGSFSKIVGYAEDANILLVIKQFNPTIKI